MSDLLRQLGRPGEVLVSLDFETFYSPEYTLRKLTTEAYVRDPRFEVIGVGVKWADRAPVWLEEADFRAWAARVDWSRVALNAHHNQFDGLILSHHYGVHPGFMLCTMSMARALHGVSGVALETLGPKYGIGEKGKGLEKTSGKRRADFTQAQWLEFGEYCRRDVELTAGLLAAMAKRLPPLELWAIDMTIRAFTEPVFVANQAVLSKALTEERAKKRALLERVATAGGVTIPPGASEAEALELTRSILSSSDKFAALLRSLSVEPPTKIGKNGVIYAFAKSDPGMQALLEHEREEIQLLAEARLSVKSTIIETRTDRLAGCARRGSVPFYLKYCLAAETRVLTERGWLPIVDVSASDRVWDGAEWVNHAGLIEQGEREVIEWRGLGITPEHELLTASGWKSWQTLTRSESDFRLALSSAPLPSLIGGSKELPAGAGLDCSPSFDARAAGRGSFTSDFFASGFGAGEVVRTVGAFTENDVLMPCPTSASGRASLPACTGSLPDAQTQQARRSRTTAGEGSPSLQSGLPTTPRFSATSKPSRGGHGLNSTLTESTTLAGMNPETCGSSPARRTASTSERSPSCSAGSTPSRKRTQTYDLALAGPRNRFTILSSAGPLIAHNCGAHTHRWSGGDKMNPQNFNRGGALRDAIEAPPGHVLVVADSGQIEARVVAWLARESGVLETFKRNDALTAAFTARVATLVKSGIPEKIAKKQAKAEGLREGDFYSDRGSAYFLKPISKEDTPIERQLSKNMELGLGFGMGWAKFAGELLKGMLGADPVQFGQAEADRYGVDVAEFEQRQRGRNGTCGDAVDDLITFGARLERPALLVHCAVACYFVDLYRRTNGRISRLWQAMSSGLQHMEQGTPARFGPLEFRRHAMAKPSGLVMHYPGLRRSESGQYLYQGGKSGREPTKVYGGLLTENAVQSLARDVVAEQALRVRADGYRIGTTTHDEIVAVVPEAEGERALARMLEHMRTPPAWCVDLPLNASGGFGVSYGAVK